MLLKNFLKTIIYSFFRLLPSKDAVILMYHSVADNSSFFTVTPAEFEKQMAYLKENNFNVVSVSHLVEALENKKQILPKTIVITIDDGYEDNFTNAFPVLKKYNFPASIFLVTDSVGGERQTSAGLVFKKLSWQQVQEMSATGLIDFYPHTKTHPKLDQVLENAVTEEIRGSKNTVEERMNKTADIFAYPYGRYTPSVVNILKQEGFKAALTVKTGRVKNGDNPFLLKRNSIDSKVSLTMFKGIVNHGRI